MAAVLAVLLSLCASTCWGLSDFLAGLVSRRLPVLTVMFGAQTLGLLGCVAALALVAPSPPSGAHALAALAAGASGVVGLACFYRALAVGTMSVVAPIGATGVALPVLVGLAGGDRLHAAQAVGLVLTVCGVVLASRPAEVPAGAAAGIRGGRRSVLLALAAAAGFGGYFVFAHSGARGGVLWLLVLSHLVVLPLGVMLVLSRRPLLAPRADAPLIALIAVVDLSATALYGVANRHGGLAIVAVAGSLYPAVTVLLARAVLHERVGRTQGAGVLAALGGVALLAGG
jgi:drug/metabolite transporter (DMT)-like permease